MIITTSRGEEGWGPGVHLKPPLWSLANIKCVAADITRGVANILDGVAIILRGMARILSNVPDILHVQHQFCVNNR